MKLARLNWTALPVAALVGSSVAMAQDQSSMESQSSTASAPQMPAKPDPTVPSAKRINRTGSHKE